MTQPTPDTSSSWPQPVASAPVFSRVDHQQTIGSYGSGELLGVVAGELAARGLDVQDVRVNGVLTAIEVLNPAGLDRGSIRIESDGSFLWEYWAPLSGRSEVTQAIEMAAKVLSMTALPNRGQTEAAAGE
jgi:hypothetical protein